MIPSTAEDDETSEPDDEGTSEEDEASNGCVDNEDCFSGAWCIADSGKCDFECGGGEEEFCDDDLEICGCIPASDAEDCSTDASTCDQGACNTDEGKCCFMDSIIYNGETQKERCPGIFSDG